MEMAILVSRVCFGHSMNHVLIALTSGGCGEDKNCFPSFLSHPVLQPLSLKETNRGLY